VTVVLHGYNVPENVATDTFFPRYFKRLYWAGHPVHTGQMHPNLGPAHTIGITWPGDQHSALDPLGLSTAVLFPEDEFHALQAGVPLSALLREVIDKPSSRRVDVIAHSLGNMVVNSALMQPGMGHVVNTFVMNEAAVPAEAFNTNYTYSELERRTMFPQARRYGYSDAPGDALDGVWRTEWADMEAGHPLLPGTDGTAPTPDFAHMAAWKLERDSDTHLFPKPRYETRWSQQGRPDELPGTDTVPVPRRGPWKGFFAANRTKVRLVNTYNPNDQVLRIDQGSIDIDPARFAISSIFAGIPGLFLPTVIVAEPLSLYAWYACQRIQKPRIGYVPGVWTPFVRVDGRSRRFWATLRTDTRSSEYLWGEGGNHSNVVRQWAELAFWFPSLSQAAGTVDLASAGIDSVSFAAFGTVPGPSLIGAQSHSYMTDRPLELVWPAFRQLGRLFAGDE
jgi:hypothetical protein